RERVGAGCGRKNASIAQPDDADVVILPRNADSAHGIAGREGSLTHQCHIGSLVHGAVEAIGPKIQSVGAARSESHGSVEQNGVRAAEAVVGRGPIAAEETPTVVVRVGRGGDAGVTNQIVRLIEVRVVHGHVGRVRSILINQGEAAIAKVSARPGGIRMEPRRSIVLGTSDAKVSVSGMYGNALELSGVETG